LDGGHDVSVVKQLFREFRLPLLLATLWAVYNTWPFENLQAVQTWVIFFAPAFFFLSWLQSHYFRVAKQQRVEGGLNAIESRVEGLLAALGAASDATVASVTGGDSFCYLLTGKDGSFLIHEGKYPLYDLSVEVLDASKGLGGPRQNYFIGNLSPGFAHTVPIALPTHGEEFQVKLFFNARNGSWAQKYARLRSCESLSEAIVVQRGFDMKAGKNKEIFIQVDPSFPRDVKDEIDWRLDFT
jgi:hypothetical protein